MEKVILMLMPLVAVALIIIPLIVSFRRKKQGKTVNMKKSVLINAGSFVSCLVLMIILMPNIASAEAAKEAVENAEAAAGGIAEGMKYLGAALSTGLATIGTGIAVGGAAPAAPVAEIAPEAPAAVPAADTGKLNAIILAAIADKTGYPEDMIDNDMELEADLGIDSIKRVEIFAEVLKALGITLTPDQTEELSTMSTVEAISAYLSALV